MYTHIGIHTCICAQLNTNVHMNACTHPHAYTRNKLKTHRSQEPILGTLSSGNSTSQSREAPRKAKRVP